MTDGTTGTPFPSKPTGSTANDVAGIPILALRPREAAKALGVSPRTLWSWTRDGRVPCVRIGTGKRKAVLYPVDTLRAFLARQSRTTEGGV